MEIRKRNYDENVLDLFRVFATAQVFLGHVITHFMMENPPTQAIYFVRGVPILFVLCGFLAGKSIENKNIKEYLIGRAVRILPEFWMCIVFNTIIILLIYPLRPTIIEALIYMVTQFSGLNFYTGEWLREYGVGAPNGVLWTITVQIQFFLLVPFLKKILKNMTLFAMGWLVSICTIFSIVCEKLSFWMPEIISKLLNVTIFPYMYIFLIGMTAWYHRDTIISKLERKRWILLLSYVLWKVCEKSFSFSQLFDGAMYNTAEIVLLGMIVIAFGFRKTFRLKNDYTYGFYLYHRILINILVEFGIDSVSTIQEGILITIIVAAITLFISIVSQNIVAVPINRMLRSKH